MFKKIKRNKARLNVASAILSIVALVGLIVGQVLFLPSTKVALADELTYRSLDVINPLPSVISEYQFNFDNTTGATVGSMLFQFCSNSPTYGLDCVAPNGFSASQATITSQSGMSGFAVVPGMPDNELLLSRLPSFASPQSNAYIFDNIVNTSDTGESFVRVSIYSSTDASGAPIDVGGIAYAITNALNINTEVPQFLEFCAGVDILGFSCGAATGDSINFGEFTSKVTTSATSQLLAATNADFGYNVSVDGTTLTSGNNIIAPVSGATPQVGVNQFGLNLVANNTPFIGDDPTGPGQSTANPLYSQPDHYRFNSGDTLITAPTSDDYHKFTVSYMVNVSSGQPAGEYAATMYYICLANF